MKKLVMISTFVAAVIAAAAAVWGTISVRQNAEAARLQRDAELNAFIHAARRERVNAFIHAAEEQMMRERVKMKLEIENAEKHIKNIEKHADPLDLANQQLILEQMKLKYKEFCRRFSEF